VIHLLVSAAFATTWWAAGPEEAEAVRAALDAGWPGHGIEVRIGAPGEGDVVWTEGTTLVARLGDEERRQEAPDPSLQVVLVRSWTRDLVVEDAGWIPEAPPPPEPVAPRYPQFPETPPRPILSASVGSALRASDAMGLAVVSIEGGVRVKDVGGIMRLEGNDFEVTNLEWYGYRTRSLSGSFGFVGWPLLAPKASWSFTVGFRARQHRVTWTHPAVDPIGRWTTMHATTRVAARWTEPVGKARVGGSVGVELDGPMELAGELPEESGSWPVLAVAELVVERR
jgi:hypothetical protein